jgi:glycerophosphoryl diester phosphodiesterase
MELGFPRGMHETGLKAVESPRRERTPLVIGHRGAPSYRPEHTLASYELAIDLGADLIEPDLVVTRDGALVARHESELSRSTDIAAHPEFATRRRTQEVDGEELTGWFTEDFTLAELRTLGAVERMPSVRPLNTAYDGRFGVLTLAEIVELAERRSTPGHRVRVQAELKSPGWSAEMGLPMTELLAAELRRLDADRADGSVVVMAFEPQALRELRSDLGHDGTRLVQLIEEEGIQDALVTPAGLREISTYADGISPHKGRILLHGADGTLVGVSDLITQAHRAGLTVEPWTLRPENLFLPSHLRRGSDPSGIGDAQTEARLLLALGVDSVITDAPETAHRARAELTAEAMAPIRPRV